MTKDLRNEKQSGEFKTKISNLAAVVSVIINQYCMHLKNLILKKLCNNKDVVVLRPDKGSGTVVLNRDQYIKRLFDIIGDTSNFKTPAADAILMTVGQLQRFLRKLKNQ